MTTHTHSIPTKVYERRWKTLAVLSLSLLIIGLDNTILNVALPSLQDGLAANGSALQWIVDSYLLVFAGLLLTFGAFGDRFGRRLALLLGLAIFGLSSLGVLIVDSTDGLIVVRALMGVGAALIMPATLSIISNTFPREERPKAIGIWAAVAAVGIGLGPLAGGLLLEWFSWRSVFLVNVPVAAIALLLAIRLVPESRDPRPGRFDLVGAGLSIAGLVALVYTIIEAPNHGWLAPITLGAFALSLALLAAFVVWELRVAEPMLNLSYFRNRRFGIGSTAISLSFFALMGALYGLTQYLQSAHGFSSLEAGAAMTPLALGLMLGARSGAHLSARFGTTRFVTGGLGLVALMLSLTLLWSPSTPYWALGCWFFVLAAGMGWVMAPSTAAVMGAVPASKSGVASAMNDVSRQVSGALGVAVIGSLTTSLYASRIDDSTVALPAEAAEIAEGSIGGAIGVAGSLPAAEGAALTDEAATAFTHALGLGLLGAGLIAAVGAAIVARFLPAWQRESEETETHYEDSHETEPALRDAA
jgi:EmrB/QacA subfamily drug resistance transporter